MLVRFNKRICFSKNEIDSYTNKKCANWLLSNSIESFHAFNLVLILCRIWHKLCCCCFFFFFFFLGNFGLKMFGWVICVGSGYCGCCNYKTGIIVVGYCVGFDYCVSFYDSDIACKGKGKGCLKRYAPHFTTLASVSTTLNSW